MKSEEKKLSPAQISELLNYFVIKIMHSVINMFAIFFIIKCFRFLVKMVQ